MKIHVISKCTLYWTRTLVISVRIGFFIKKWYFLDPKSLTETESNSTYNLNLILKHVWTDNKSYELIKNWLKVLNLLSQVYEESAERYIPNAIHRVELWNQEISIQSRLIGIWDINYKESSPDFQEAWNFKASQSKSS